MSNNKLEGWSTKTEAVCTLSLVMTPYQAEALAEICMDATNQPYREELRKFANDISVTLCMEIDKIDEATRKING